MGAVCKFAGIVMWLVDLILASSFYQAITELQELQKVFGGTSDGIDSVTVTAWSCVLMVFAFGLILFSLGMVYDNIMTLQDGSQENWKELWARLQRIEKKIKKTSNQITQTGQANTVSEDDPMPQETGKEEEWWKCPECGVSNQPSNQSCMNCGFPKKAVNSNIETQ